MRLAIVLAAAFAAVLACCAGGPARAYDALQAELAVYDTEIKNQTLLLHEIERQAKVRAEAVLGQMEWLLSVQRTAADLARRSVVELEYQASEVDKAVALLNALYAESPDTTFVLPVYGHNTAASIAAYAQESRNKIQQQKALIAAGKMEMFIASYGLTTPERIQADIDGLKQKMADLEKAYGEGTLDIWVGGLGWVKAADIAAKIDAAEQAKAAVQKRVADGDYEIMIPGVGLRTRKAFDAEIAAAEKELQALRGKVQAGEVEVNHILLSWATPARMRAALEQQGKDNEALKVALDGGSLDVWMPEVGHVTRAILEAALKDDQARAAQVQEQLGSGEYAASTFLGGITRKGAEEALQVFAQQLANPDLKQADQEAINLQIARLQRALADYEKVAAFDQEMLEDAQIRLRSLIGSILPLLEPEATKRLADRKTVEDGLAAYPTEMQVLVTLAENKLAFLKKQRELFP